MEAPFLVTAAEPRQRWRMAYGRSIEAPHLAPRDQLAAWEQALTASGLPIVGLDVQPRRPRIAFAAPLGVGLPADRELADLFLTDRRPVAEVREALAGNLPGGHVLVGLHDVWLGAPALAGQVVAADYRARVTVDGSLAAGPQNLADAARRLLTETSLPRTRDKGGRPILYDLRPLLADIVLTDIEIRAGGAPPIEGAIVELRIRVRFDPERGMGRPEEVLAALAESAGVGLSFKSLVRERVLLARGD